MASWALFVQGIPAGIVFGDLYFSDSWQFVFSIDNSFFAWFLVILAGFWWRLDWLLVAGAAAILHLLLDFPLHHDDGRAHFWPFTDWIFRSPVSYWDPAHYGRLVGGLESLLCLALTVILLIRFKSKSSKALIVLLGLTGVFPVLAPVIFG